MGAEFKWSNGRGGGRHSEVGLDRILCKAYWLVSWSDTSCRTLVREFSDHHPILLKFDNYVRRFPKTFRFLSCWLQHEDFMDMVKENWEARKLGGYVKDDP